MRASLSSKSRTGVGSQVVAHLKHMCLKHPLETTLAEELAAVLLNIKEPTICAGFGHYHRHHVTYITAPVGHATLALGKELQVGSTQCCGSMPIVHRVGR